MKFKIRVRLPHHVIIKTSQYYPDNNINTGYFSLLHTVISMSFVSLFLHQSGPNVRIHEPISLASHTFPPPNTYLANVIYFFSLLILASQILVGNLGSLFFCNTVWLGKCCLKQKLLIIVIFFKK